MARCQDSLQIASFCPTETLPIFSANHVNDGVKMIEFKNLIAIQFALNI